MQEVTISRHDQLQVGGTFTVDNERNQETATDKGVCGMDGRRKNGYIHFFDILTITIVKCIFKKSYLNVRWLGIADTIIRLI